MAIEWLDNFVFERLQYVYTHYLVLDPRLRGSARAKNALWALLRAKLTKDDYQEVRNAFLKLEPLLRGADQPAKHAAYMQGLKDGVTLANAKPSDSFSETVDTEADKHECIQEAHALMKRLLKEYGDIEEVV